MGDESKELEWALVISVPAQQIQRTILVTSNETIGAVMIKLTNRLAESDWSDYILWWPDKQIWLDKPRQTLHGYGIQADARLEFVPTHRNVIIELPDKKQYRVRINFAVRVFQVVEDLCKEFRIRHHEELSLMKSPLDKEGYDKQTGGKKLSKKARSHRGATPISQSASFESGEILGDTSVTDSPRAKKKLPKLAVKAVNPSEGTDQPILPSFAAANHLGDAPDGGIFNDKIWRTVYERAYLNGLWLDSSLSLTEQEVAEDSLLYLRFKYHSIADLDQRAKDSQKIKIKKKTKTPRITDEGPSGEEDERREKKEEKTPVSSSKSSLQVDENRINQLYEQAKWSVLTEDVDCTEDEVFAFAALQFQVKLAATIAPNQKQGAGQITDIDEALSNLQANLGQEEKKFTPEESPNLQLKGPIKYSQPTRLTLRGAKKHYFTLKGTTLTMYKSEAEANTDTVMNRFNISGAEVLPDIDAGKGRYIINLTLASQGEEAIRLTFEESDDFCSWMAGFRMVSKGKQLAKQGYDTEYTAIKNVVALQNRSGGQAAANSEELHPEDVMPPRILKKHKTKVLVRSILEAHASMLSLTLMDAKLQYINNWKKLQDFGVSLFIVRINRSKKDEVIGVAYNRLVLINPLTLEQKKTWRYSAMRSWNVNWESRQIRIDHEEEELLIDCISANLKVLHEYIGGNIFLSLRQEKEPLDVGMFYKLTAGVESHATGFASEISGRI